MHFALTFVIQYNAKNLYEIICDKKKLTTDELSQYFIDLINYINKIKNKNNIEFFLTQLLKLSIYLNFSKNDVFKSYYNKSKINIERSNSNY